MYLHKRISRNKPDPPDARHTRAFSGGAKDPSQSSLANDEYLGRTITDKAGSSYQIIEQLASGGSGAVYRALGITGSHTGQEVVVKVARRDLPKEARIVDRFRNEITMLKKIAEVGGHPNIVKFLTYIETPRELYLVMELLPPYSLSAFITRQDRIHTTSKIAMLLPILDALAFIHQPRFSLVHRDLKPENIHVAVLKPANGPSFPVPVLIDLGIAKKTGLSFGEQLTVEHALVGTPGYMSPDHLGSEIDGRADLYSFGIILYQFLTGILPFEAGSSYDEIRGNLLSNRVAPSVRALNHLISPELEQVVLKLLEHDPDRRYQTAQEVKQALEELRDTNRLESDQYGK